MSVAAPNRRKLLDECRETVVLRMAEVVHEALDRMGEHLADEAVQCIGAEQRQALLEALSVVREHRLEIEARFRRAFADVFERRMAGDAQPATAAGSPAGGLSLVADDVIDDRIEVERLARRAHARLDPDEVLGIRARLGALVERGWFDEGAHPASPQAVFEALKAALADVAPHAEVKRALLDAFEPHVSANLNGIYRRMNQRLVDHQILPRIRLVAVSQRAATPAMSAPPALGSGLFGPPPDAAAGAQADLPPAAASGGTAGPRAGVGACGQADAALEAVLLRLARGQPSVRLSAARVLSDPDLFGAAGAPLPAPHAQLLDALSSLQAHAARGRADAADELLSGADLFRLLAEQAREQGSPLDQITVEVVSTVFGYIDSDQRLPDVVRHQLMRLQVVAVKAALIDRTFFARRQHPMRRLIDRVCEIGADPDLDMAAGSPLLAGLAQATDRIVAEFDRDLAVFEQALAGIERLARAETEQRARWLAEQTARAERQDLLSAAREQAAVQVALRLQADMEAPDFMRAFLSNRWVEVLAASRGESEQPPPAWDEALRVVEDLLWSIAPKLPGEVVQLAQLLPGLIAALMRGLKRIDLPDEERQAFFDALLAAHTQAIAAAKAGPVPLRREAAPRDTLRQDAFAAAAAGRPVPVAVAACGAAPRDTDAAAAARITAADGAGSTRLADAPDAPAALCAADPALLEALRRGDCIELTGDDGLLRRYKLAWISPTRRLFVLSRYPHEARSLDRAALAGLLERGQARVVQPEASMLDRAIVAATHEPALSLA